MPPNLINLQYLEGKGINNGFSSYFYIDRLPIADGAIWTFTYYVHPFISKNLCHDSNSHRLDLPQGSLGNKATTLSPIDTPSTLSPTATTSPAGSCPPIIGQFPPKLPSLTIESVWHKPDALMCNRTLVPFGEGVSCS